MPKSISPNPVTKSVTARAFTPTYTTSDPNGTESAVLFETNFSQDAGYTHAGNGNNASTTLTGFSGVKATANSRGENALEVITSGGQTGNALRVRPAADASNPVVNLFRHLSGTEGEGFTDVYIRYVFKFPDTFKAGGGSSQLGELGYWKFMGRLWANTGTAVGDKWTENRADSNYAVLCNLNGPNAPDYGITCNAVFCSADAGSGDKALGSVGGPRQGLSWYVSETPGSDAARYGLGRFERMTGLRFNWTAGADEAEFETTPQTWHTIELRAKMATDSEDGIFQLWFDGEDQGEPPTVNSNGGAPSATGVTTHPDDGAWDMVVFFDNLVHWVRDWDQSGVDGYVDVDSFVVSRAPIGTSYAAQNGGYY